MLDIVIDSRSAEISPGFSVKRILPFQLRRMVCPFIFMDHGGPINIPHGHLNGLDVGVVQVIEPREVNWMTTGSGISHSERLEDPAMLNGGQLEMMQTWVALPQKDEETNPTFTNYSANVLPVFSDKDIWMRLIAGEAFGIKNKVKTHSPLF